MTAAWDDAVYMNREIKRGQCCTTVKELAAINQRTVQQTRTALNHLVSTNDITIEATTQFSIITLTNYDELQPVGKPPDRQITNERQTVQQTGPAETNKPTIIKEKKNIKEDEEETGLLRRLEYLTGDANNDLVVNALDASEILKYVTGYASFDADKLETMDMNGDGAVNALDASSILKRAVGLIA